MTFSRKIVSCGAVWLCLAATSIAVPPGDSATSPSAGGAALDFARDVQPIFEKNCHECHGAQKSKAGLRLDLKAAALKGGDTGRLLVEGDSAKSLLIQAVAGTHAEISRMPKKRDPLSADQIALLRAWIDQGAIWPDVAAATHSGADHWAFKAPRRPPIPDVKDKRWVRDPVDAFVLAALEREQLKPSAAADNITLLRRLSLDLIGLPPTVGEVDAFLADKSPEAYETQVERLLASPHYGERWASHWLDAARYADSDGFEKDKPRFIWAYRDWVIRSLNADLPYDRFIIEQIAGDLLPDATQDQIVATGFLRNAMLNEEGGVDPEQFRMEGLFDRVDCIGKSVLGITIQCAQCHNHKFDPLTQEEYYRLFAFLNNDHEASRVTYTPEQQMRVANLTRQMRDLEAGLRHVTPHWQERMDQWEAAVKSDPPPWVVVRCVNAGDNGERFYHYEDGSIRAASYAPTKWTARFRGTNTLPVIGAFQLEQLTDPNLPCGGPGRSVKGMAALSEFKVEAIDLLNPTNKIEVKFVTATADFSNPERELEAEFNDNSEKKRVYGPVAFAIDGKDDTGWGIDAGPGRRNQPRKAVFIPEKPIAFTNGVELNIRLVQNHGGSNSDDNQNHNLGRFRVSVTASTNAVADPIPAGVREILRIPREQRTPAQTVALFTYWRTCVPEFKETNDKIEDLWKQWPEGVPTLTLMARDGGVPEDSPRSTRMLKRGDWLKPGNEVDAGVPAFLHALPAKADASRLTLARWLVDKRSPTTARALANRIWQAYFGMGLVSTPEDFGTRCESPSHPELLDWLACELMDPTVSPDPHRSPGPAQQPAMSWSLKHLHRLIVTSATYRQSSRVTTGLFEKDPYNRMLARGPRFRVDAEFVRDIALAASGLLNRAIGGRSIYPPSPEFLYLPPASYGPKTWTEDAIPERYRRSLYIFKFRSVPFPMLQTFDAPNGDFSCVRRQRSNSPLQALVSLNETQFVDCARALARKTLADGGDTDGERISYAFRRTLSRAPTDAESKTLLALLDKERRHIAEGWVSAPDLATGSSESPAGLPQDVTPTQLAAYTVVSRVLLNLDETITKE